MVMLHSVGRVGCVGLFVSDIEARWYNLRVLRTLQYPIPVYFNIMVKLMCLSNLLTMLEAGSTASVKSLTCEM